MRANEPPMSDAGGDAAAELTSDQHAALESRQVDQDRTLASVHALEGALASAAPGREGPWRDSVRAALDVLGEAAAEEERNAAQPDSLLSDIARSQPRLRHRVHGLRGQYRQGGRAQPPHPAAPARPGVRPHLRGVLRGVRPGPRARRAIGAMSRMNDCDSLDDTLGVGADATGPEITRAYRFRDQQRRRAYDEP